MRPQQALAAYRRAMKRGGGETIQIRRYTGSGSTRTHADTATQARVNRLEALNTGGTAVQYRYQIIALVDTLASILPVTTADRVVLDDGKELAIKEPGDRKRRVAGKLIALDMVCEG